ncbi:MAG: LysM peptidoglycan-binding domain-containing protein [Tannerella sp.]|jgi:membrane-bound lytic murein transglycosylase D|nr:LysM peptidoglycan-binding domain-containing protein [Tannerella sp.]
MKRLSFLTLFTLCLLSFSSVAQDVEEEEVYSVLSSDSTFSEVGLIPETLDANVNALLDSWHTQYFSKAIDYCIDNDENVNFTDEVYWQRLSKLPCIIPMDYNRHVRNCIDLYANRRRDLVRYMMGMADLYFPIFEQILDQYNLPLELKYLAVVESALNPRALSRVGATGMWQFMLPTAKLYNLEINSLIDERLDVVKATHAACRHLADLYAIYGDWHLVLAAYNSGPGNVNKAIRRSGGKTNFWEIYPRLPRETRSYVPLFIAATYIMTYYCEHNLCPMQTSLSMATDTIMVNQLLHLQQVADILNLDIEYLRMLNPQYKREIIPGNITPSVLKLPVASTYQFIDKEDTIYKHRLEELLAYCTPVQDGESTGETIKHTVVSGENLYTIAGRYGVTAKNLRQWNGLGSNKVAPGRRITVHINNGGLHYAPPPAEPTTASAPTGNSATSKVASTSDSASSNETLSADIAANTKTITYKVKSGDTLYDIARRHPGATVSKIQSANQMNSSKLRVGQILKIPTG